MNFNKKRYLLLLNKKTDQKWFPQWIFTANKTISIWNGHQFTIEFFFFFVIITLNIICIHNENKREFRTNTAWKIYNTNWNKWSENKTRTLKSISIKYNKTGSQCFNQWVRLVLEGLNIQKQTNQTFSFICSCHQSNSIEII